MTHQERANTDRLRNALLAFQTAQKALLAAERKLRDSSSAEPKGCVGQRMLSALHVPFERHVEIAATEVVAAVMALSEAGQIASAEDQRHISEAKRYLAQPKA
jgi:hypothetical protein